MEPTRHLASAPWPTSLKLSTALGTLLLIGVGIASYRASPRPSGFTRSVGTALTLVLPALLILSIISTVTGYVVSSTDLAVQRLFWASHVSLVGVSRAYMDPSACKGSSRIIGNAGLFGFTGLYHSPRLGRFRLFATDLTHSVVLVLPNRTLVITPAAAQAFVAHLNHIFPATSQALEPPVA